MAEELKTGEAAAVKPGEAGKSDAVGGEARQGRQPAEGEKPREKAKAAGEGKPAAGGGEKEGGAKPADGAKAKGGGKAAEGAKGKGAKPAEGAKAKAAEKEPEAAGQGAQRLRVLYREKIAKALREEFGYSSVQQVPEAGEDRRQHGRGGGHPEQEAPGRGRQGAGPDHRPEGR